MVTPLERKMLSYLPSTGDPELDMAVNDYMKWATRVGLDTFPASGVFRDVPPFLVPLWEGRNSLSFFGLWRTSQTGAKAHFVCMELPDDPAVGVVHGSKTGFVLRFLSDWVWDLESSQLDEFASVCEMAHYSDLQYRGAWQLLDEWPRLTSPFLVRPVLQDGGKERMECSYPYLDAEARWPTDYEISSKDAAKVWKDFPWLRAVPDPIRAARREAEAGDWRKALFYLHNRTNLIDRSAEVSAALDHVLKGCSDPSIIAQMRQWQAFVR